MKNYIAVDDALRTILRHVTPVRVTERVTLAASVGRVLAEPVDAPLDWPPFPRAAMDGYAFRAVDTPGTLHVAGTLFAGDVWAKPLLPGQALRIMTGAPVPGGFDTVLEKEAVEPGDTIAVLKPVKPGRNIMAQGHEYTQGTRILERNTRITPLAAGQLAALGLSHVDVLKKPRVLIIITGNELTVQGKPLSPGHIYDANGPLFRALTAGLGARPTVRYVRDNERQMLGALRDAKNRFDLVLTTGSVSVGDRDYLPALLERHFERLFWRVDMHPGKAMAAGLLAPGLPMVALSGNPGASLTAWHLIAAPAIAALTSQPYHLKPVTGRLAQPYGKPTRETRYLKARFVRTPDGIRYQIIDNQSSDALSSFAQADGLVIIPHNSEPQPAGQTLTGLILPKAL